MKKSNELFKSLYKPKQPIIITNSELISNSNCIANLNVVYFLHFTKHFNIYPFLDIYAEDIVKDIFLYSGYFTTDVNAFLLPRNELFIKGQIDNKRDINIEGVALPKINFNSDYYSVCKFIARNYSYTEIVKKND